MIKEINMSKKLIDMLVNRFLMWKLPENFSPDCGISFKPSTPYSGDEFGNSSWPIGTNLLTADQAKQMLEYILGSAIILSEQYSTEEEAAAFTHGYFLGFDDGIDHPDEITLTDSKT